MSSAAAVGVGAELQEQRHHLVVAAEGGAEEGRLAVGVDALDVHTFSPRA